MDYFLFVWLLVFLAFIVLFLVRKNKMWFNYLALAGELLYLINFLFHIQHYPWQFQIGLAGSLLLITAFVATLSATKQNKIPSSLKLGATLCLYVFMILGLSESVFHYYHDVFPG
jgi:hypothetical protein